MEIMNVRLDERLIHGQVATGWCRYFNVDRIVVCDNDVVKDKINKDGLKIACPQGVKLSIITTTRLIENLEVNKYQGEKLLILVKKPQTLCELYERGFQFSAVTVGNMGAKANSKMIKKAVSVTPEDEKEFQKLGSYGVKINGQMVPADPVVDILNLI